MRHVVRIAFALALSLFALQVATANTVEQLLREPSVRAIDLSPDGKKIGIAFSDQSEDEDVLGVIDADRLGQPDALKKEPLNPNVRWRVLRMFWATSDRLVVAVEASSGKRGNARTARRAWSVAPDLSDWKLLLDERRFSGFYDLSQLIGYYSAHQRHVMIKVQSDMYSVDVYTGKGDLVERGNRETIGWALDDDGRPAVRVDLAGPGADMFMYARGQKPRDWFLLSQYGYWMPKSELEFAANAPGPGRIYALTRVGGETYRISEYDLDSASIGKTIASAEGHDIESVRVSDGALVAARYTTDRVSYVFLDDKLQQAFAELNSHFGPQANVEFVDDPDARRQDPRFVLDATRGHWRAPAHRHAA